MQISNEAATIRVKEEHVEEVAEHIKWRFRTAIELAVPIEAEASWGATWGTAK